MSGNINAKYQHVPLIGNYLMAKQVVEYCEDILAVGGTETIIDGMRIIDVRNNAASSMRKFEFAALSTSIATVSLGFAIYTHFCG